MSIVYFTRFSKVTRHGRVLGNRTIAGRVVKESYGAAKQQHTFTVSLNCTGNRCTYKNSILYYSFGLLFEHELLRVICALIRCGVQWLSWLVKYVFIVLAAVLVLAELFSRSMTNFFFFFLLRIPLPLSETESENNNNIFGFIVATCISCGRNVLCHIFQINIVQHCYQLWNSLRLCFAG